MRRYSPLRDVWWPWLLGKISAIPKSETRQRLGVGLEPLSDRLGFDRGLPIHRYYVEHYLQTHATDIRGHCLEFQWDTYTRRFGGPAVTKSDILHHDVSNPVATL